MTEVSTHVLDHIIVFHDKSTLQITEKAAKHIDRELMEGKTSHLKINGTTYSKGAISKIMLLQEYYEQYPDKKPSYDSRFPNWTEQRINTEDALDELGMVESMHEKPLGMGGIIGQAKSAKGLNQMMKGFADAGSKEHPLYKSMEQKLKQMNYDNRPI